MLWFGVASYGLAALAFGAAAAVLSVSRPGSRRASLLTVVVGLSAAWAAALVVLLLTSEPSPGAVGGIDALHTFLWTACVLSWLSSPSRYWLLGLSAFAGCSIVLATIAAAWLPGMTDAVYPTLVVMALIGFLGVEQVYRNAPEDTRRSLHLLCPAVAGIFVVDLFVYSQAAFLKELVLVPWEARGLVNAALVPPILLAVKRQPEWEQKLYVSRDVVFYTASLLGVAVYLVVMGIVVSMIRAFGGEWSLPFELAFLVAALAILAWGLFSTEIRMRARVFLVKHFYRNKYDYRYEWLRLTQSLGRSGDLPVLAHNALDGLARIVGSQQGELWLACEPHRYECMATLDRRLSHEARFDCNHPIVLFLASKGWVIDSEEYAREPDRYHTAFGRPQDGLLPAGSIIVPLDCQGYLQGFVVIEKPRALKSLNFEDHDLLKTAGRQVAVVLAQALAQERLAETRQFEAMNKLSMFLMHDLKNIVAQQELVVANAQRFRHRPEFIEDAIETVRSGVERMKRVLDQLNSRVRSEAASGRADVSKILMEVRSHCADREPVPEIQVGGPPIWVRMDREKLYSILTHLVRNAQDATPADGRIVIDLQLVGEQLVVSVEDTGKGMDQSFIRNRLFRPFDTTKGTRGMGIGAYQVRDTVRAAGGDVEVFSEPGVGTRFCVRLPVARGEDDTLAKQPAA
ncbi:MAG TPA: XrtA/PEP-CTERM system histidine kinase PrsK [Gammaproteobacteria bacterium]